MQVENKRENTNMTRSEARSYGVIIGKLTTSKDSRGEYILKEDGYIVAEGYYDSASEIKQDWIAMKVNAS